MNTAFMDEAIRLSVETMSEGKDGPFGAVVVKDNNIIGRGANAVISTNDPTAHAEIIAIREASKNIGSFTLEGCEIYTSCEPCPMCLAAVYWARINTIYYANTRHDARAAGFDDVHLYEEVAMPSDRRSITMKNIMREKAIKAFEEWKRLPGRIIY